MENIEKYTTSELISKAENSGTSNEEIDLCLDEIVKRLLAAKILYKKIEKFYNFEKSLKDENGELEDLKFSKLIANGDEETVKFRLKAMGLSDKQSLKLIENEKAIIKRVLDSKAKDDEERQ